MGKITINIVGGLANQLFEIFFLLGVAKKFQMEPVFPNIYNIPCGPNDTKRHTYYHLFPDIKLGNVGAALIYDQPQPGYKPINIDPRQNYVFFGHYQSYLYLQDINPREYIKLPEEDEKQVNKVLHTLRSSGKTLIAVHVRRGDYLNAQHCHNVLDVSYYKNAQQHIKNIDNPLFVVFSEDREWCEKNLSFLGDVVFIRNKDYVDLFIMAGCDHYIVANSSFSWWGAFLNDSTNKIVVYPDKWFANGLDTSSLCPPKWTSCRVK